VLHSLHRGRPRPAVRKIGPNMGRNKQREQQNVICRGYASIWLVNNDAEARIDQIERRLRQWRNILSRYTSQLTRVYLPKGVFRPNCSTKSLRSQNTFLPALWRRQEGSADLPDQTKTWQLLPCALLSLGCLRVHSLTLIVQAYVLSARFLLIQG
jgi:uncharacterized protein Veg